MDITPDALLACLFPLAILSLCYRVFPSTTFSDVREFVYPKSPAKNYGPFSLETALTSYMAYPALARNELTRMRNSYATLPRAHKRIGYNLGYPRKLDKLQDATDVNSVVTSAIADLARAEFGAKSEESGVIGSDANLGRV